MLSAQKGSVPSASKASADRGGAGGAGGATGCRRAAGRRGRGRRLGGGLGPVAGRHGQDGRQYEDASHASLLRRARQRTQGRLSSTWNESRRLHLLRVLRRRRHGARWAWARAGPACSPTTSTRSRPRPTAPTCRAATHFHRGRRLGARRRPTCRAAPTSPGPPRPARTSAWPARARAWPAARSSAFFGFWRLIEALDAEGRAPRADRDRERRRACSPRTAARISPPCARRWPPRATASARWRSTRRAFLPQSRPRLFVIATREPPPAGLTGDSPFHTRAVRAAHAAPAGRAAAALDLVARCRAAAAQHPTSPPCWSRTTPSPGARAAQTAARCWP